MTRSLYFIGGLVALTLVFVAQSVVLLPAPGSSAATQVDTAPVVASTAPNAVSVAIDDLAAWPAAAGR